MGVTQMNMFSTCKQKLQTSTHIHLVLEVSLRYDETHIDDLMCVTPSSHLGDGRPLKGRSPELLPAEGGETRQQHVLLEVLEQYPIGTFEVLVLLLVLHLQQYVVHVVHQKEDAIELFLG